MLSLLTPHNLSELVQYKLSSHKLVLKSHQKETFNWILDTQQLGYKQTEQKIAIAMAVINTVLCIIKVNSNTIELIMHLSCYCILDLLCVNKLI